MRFPLGGAERPVTGADVGGGEGRMGSTMAGGGRSGVLPVIGGVVGGAKVATEAVWGAPCNAVGADPPTGAMSAAGDGARSVAPPRFSVMGVPAGGGKSRVIPASMARRPASNRALRILTARFVVRVNRPETHTMRAVIKTKNSATNVKATTNAVLVPGSGGLGAVPPGRSS